MKASIHPSFIPNYPVVNFDELRAHSFLKFLPSQGTHTVSRYMKLRNAAWAHDVLGLLKSNCAKQIQWNRVKQVKVKPDNTDESHKTWGEHLKQILIIFKHISYGMSPWPKCQDWNTVTNCFNKVQDTQDVIYVNCPFNLILKTSVIE